MNFELTISGLCLTVLKSKEMPPRHPDDVEILIPYACHHVCRLSYLPLEVFPPDKYHDVKAELIDDPRSERVASWRLDHCTIALSFNVEHDDEPQRQFNVHWGYKAKQTPTAPWEETWLDWLPTLEDLGFRGLNTASDGSLPEGALARIKLPPGSIATRQMLRKPKTNDLLRWDFPATRIRKALANDLVYSIADVKDLTITTEDGTKSLITSVGKTQTVRMCLSNDMELVPENYRRDIGELEHLKHFGALAAEGEFVPPEIVPDPQRTGQPTCMGIVFIDRS